MATTEPTLAMPASTAASASSGPFRGLLLLVGSIIALGLVVGGAFTLVDVAAHHTFDVHTSYPAVQSLQIDDESGNVQLTSAPGGGRTTVTERISEGLLRPRRTATVGRGGVLRLSASCTGLDPECRVGYAVAVPVGVPVVVRSGAGDITASGLHTAGTVDLSSGAGDITASDLSGQTLQLSSDAGDIAGRRISAPQLRLVSGAGDITADVTSPVGNLVANSGAGDVRLSVPDSTYALHASSAAGDVSDPAIRTDPASPRKIDATSGAGDITITPTG